MSDTLRAFIHHLDRALVEAGAGTLNKDSRAELLAEAEDIDRRFARLEERIAALEQAQDDTPTNAESDIEDLRQDIEQLEGRIDMLEGEGGS